MDPNSVYHGCKGLSGDDDYDYDDFLDEMDFDADGEGPDIFDAPDLKDMPYYDGRITPCPMCGSNNVESYVDGSAFCRHCRRWHRYA